MPEGRQPNRYSIAAAVDIGVEREALEDFVQYEELDGTTLLAVIADGTGSREGHPHPAAIVTMEVIESVKEFREKAGEAFDGNPCAFMELAMIRANRVLQAFKAGNEELFSGYAASVTCCLLTEDDRIFVAHSGNTRLYIMRQGVLRQMTADHTKAAEMLADGRIDIDTYYVHPDRLTITSGIGMTVSPAIQTFSGRIRVDDMIVMTTDGIHYAIRPEALVQIILSARDPENAVAELVNAAKTIVKYPDNMSAMILIDRKAYEAGAAKAGAGRRARP